MPAKKNVILYGCCSDPYPDITFTLHLKRRASFYIFNLLIPCMMISFLAPLGFYLPADSGEKVSLGVTVLLALTVFQLLVAESMPPSESVPLIGERRFCLVHCALFFKLKSQKCIKAHQHHDCQESCDFSQKLLCHVQVFPPHTQNSLVWNARNLFFSHKQAGVACCNVLCTRKYNIKKIKS